MTVYGLLECPLTGVGSKSEGRRPVLTDDEGRKYKLYRAGVLPVSDKFFDQFEGQRIGVTGRDEPRTGNFLVESVLMEDGAEILPEPPELPDFPALPDDFDLSEPVEAKEASAERHPLDVKACRLSPRMKKILKRTIRCKNKK